MLYQSLQPAVDVCLKLCVVKDSSCEAKEDADGLLERLKGTSLRPPARVI